MEIRNLYRVLGILYLVLCPDIRCHGQNSIDRTEQVVSWLYSQLHVRELTGNNDGPEVEAYQKATGNKKGDFWCGSFQAYGNKVVGLPFPKGAGGSYNWFLLSSDRTFFVKGKRGTIDSVQVGDCIGFYYTNLKRIGHIGRTVKETRASRREPLRGWTSIEGNTGSGGGRNGQGVHARLRAKWEIYAASDWKTL